MRPGDPPMSSWVRALNSAKTLACMATATSSGSRPVSAIASDRAWSSRRRTLVNWRRSASIRASPRSLPSRSVRNSTFLGSLAINASMMARSLVRLARAEASSPRCRWLSASQA